MTIRDVLEVFSGQVIVSEPLLPQQPRMAKTRMLVEQSLDSIYRRATGIDLDIVHQHIRDAIIDHKLDSLSTIEWRYVPLCLLKGTPRLIEETKFIKHYLERLESQTNRLAMRHLIIFYLTFMTRRVTTKDENIVEKENHG